MAEWHEHTDARALIASAPLHNLPGLSEKIREQLRRINDNPQLRPGVSLSKSWSWPRSVRQFCTHSYAGKTGENVVRDYQGVGEGTISAIREVLEPFGIRAGMSNAAFEDWVHCIKYDKTIRV